MQKGYFSCLDLSPETQLLVYLGWPPQSPLPAGFFSSIPKDFLSVVYAGRSTYFKLSGELLVSFSLFSLSWCSMTRASQLVIKQWCMHTMLIIHKAAKSFITQSFWWYWKVENGSIWMLSVYWMEKDGCIFMLCICLAKELNI